jgi:curved DNA-binding protein CbpA
VSTGGGADPYEVLGVPADATPDELRRAYLSLARRHHPDAQGTSDPAVLARAERRMQEVNEAWSVLGDPARKAVLDGARRRRSRGPGRASAGAPFRPFDAGGADEPDPRDAPDTPYRPATAPPRRRSTTLVPVLLFAASVASFAAANVLSSAALAGLAVALFVGSCVGFVVLPLLALSAARRDEG